MIRLRILLLAVAAAFALPTVASADSSEPRISLVGRATYVSPQQINLEVRISCQEGLFYSVGGSVLQQQGSFTQVFGNGFTSGQCTGRRQKLALSIFAFTSPGWQLGEAIAQVSACAFVCDSTSRMIRVDL